MKVALVKEMQNMDQKSIDQYGIQDLILMENAGLAVSQVLVNKIGINHSFLIICGGGNNGGDGLVLARKLHSYGARIRICLIRDPNHFTGTSLLNWKIIQKMNIQTLIKPTLEEIDSLVTKNDILVDALFGTGLTRDISENDYDLIQWINQSNIPVVSIDIPSGIDGNNGQIRGIAVRADFTITFGLPKAGNLLYPGYAFNGKLFVSHISFPPELYQDNLLKIQVNHPLEIPKRSPDGHKGTFGHALFIAGSRNYYGAPYLSSLSFLKAGGGYSRLAAPSSMIPFIGLKASEVVLLPQKETVDGAIQESARDELLDWSEKSDITILGPGLSLQEESCKLIQNLVLEIHKPVIIDGDGLTALSQDMSILKKRNLPTIVTPHLGEMSRMIGESIDQILENPLRHTQVFSQAYQVTTILKGAHTIIGTPDGQLFINMTGNSGMATAGSGDVLTGTIAAMFTLGLTIESAAMQGVFVHGLAGDLAAKDKGEDGIIARDILCYLPEAMKIIRDKQKIAKFRNTGFEII